MACVQALDQVEDTTGGGLVQIAGGFVGQEQPRVVDQRTGQGDALLLAAGELAGPMVAAIVQAHLPEPVCRQFEPFPLRYAASKQRHGHVFKRRELRQQVMELPDVADLPIAKGLSLIHI